MARAGDEANAEPFDVVVRIPERVDLELAAVARTGVDLTDRQRSSKRAQNVLLQSGDDDHFIRGRRRCLGLDARSCDLVKDVQHGQRSWPL